MAAARLSEMALLIKVAQLNVVSGAAAALAAITYDVSSGIHLVAEGDGAREQWADLMTRSIQSDRASDRDRFLGARWSVLATPAAAAAQKPKERPTLPIDVPAAAVATIEVMRHVMGENDMPLSERVCMVAEIRKAAADADNKALVDEIDDLLAELGREMRRARTGTA
jgi:hypothetical protein